MVTLMKLVRIFQETCKRNVSDSRRSALTKIFFLAVLPCAAMVTVTVLQALAGSMQIIGGASVILISLPFGLYGYSQAFPEEDIDLFFALPAGLLILPVPIIALYVTGFLLNECIWLCTIFALGLTAYGVHQRSFTRIRKLTVYDGLAIGLVCIAVVLWSYDYVLEPYISDTGRLYFPYHKDAPLNSSHIWKFGHLRYPDGFSGPGLAHRPEFIYHYGAYILGASFKTISEATAIGCLLHFVIPLGYFCSNCVAYGLAARFWSSRAAIGSVVAINFCPDPAAYGGDSFFSYHWLNHITPNMNYSIAALLLSAYCVSRCCIAFSFRLFLTSIVLSFLSVFYKAQFFVVAGPSLAVILFFSLFLEKLKFSVRASFLIVSALTLSVVASACLVPRLGVDLAINRELLNRILGNSLETPISFFALILAAVKLIHFTFGVSIVGVFWAIRQWRMPYARFTCLCSLTYLALCTIVTINSQGMMEFEHRPLVMTYFVAMGFLGASITSLAFDARVPMRIRYWAFGSVVTMGLCWTFYQAPISNLIHEDQMSQVDIYPDLYAACLFLRDHSPRESVVICEAVFKFEEFALSERLFYMNSHRRSGWDRKFERHLATYYSRASFKEMFFGQRDIPRVREMARAEGIRFVLLWDREKLPWWDGMKSELVFEKGSVAVYQMW